MVAAHFRTNFLLQNVVIFIASQNDIATPIPSILNVPRVVTANLGYPEFDRYRDYLDEAIVFDK